MNISNTITQKHEVKKIGQAYFLLRDGTPLACPFRSPVMMMNAVNKPYYQDMNCGSACPKFNIVNETEKTEPMVRLECGACVSEIQVTIATDKASEEGGAKVIKL